MNLKHISRIGVAALAGLALVSCDKDGDFLTLNAPDDVSVSASADDIVLDFNNLDALALTLHWDENGNLSLSNPAVALPDGVMTNIVELSLTEDFSEPYAVTVTGGQYSCQFTVSELNSIMNRLGVGGGERVALYIRIKSSVGNNIDASYSNVLMVYVTPYRLDMSVASVYDASKTNIVRTLVSPTENGIYEGFAGVSSWENWWLLDGSGVMWGNSSTAGAFAVSADSDSWNFWYPGTAGCYYTIVNTVEGWWSALSIPELTVSGDIEGVMTFDRKTNVWSMAVDTSAGAKNITISATGTLYNMSTGDSESSLTESVALVGTADNLTRSDNASTVSVNVASPGEQVMKITLVTPLTWAVTFEAGSVEPVEEARPLLYLSGHDDGISGSWHFNNFLRLYDEDNLAYAGGVNFASEWGYKLYKEANNWDESWGSDGTGDAAAGTLLYGTNTNIPAPENGFYILNVGLDALTYETTAVTSVSYTGLNDDWSITPMTATETAGVYTAVVEKTAETPWGVKILINESWDIYFGGGDGQLLYGHDGFDGDNGLANGSYRLTVDLINGTYSYDNL